MGDPTSITRLAPAIDAATPYVSKIITWIYQHTMLSLPYFDNIGSWTGQYTLTRAAARKQLRSDYIAKYGTQTPTLVPTVPAGYRFEDVPPSHWAYSYIELTASKGITGGCQASPPLFCPERNLTRAEAAVFLLKSIHGSSYSPPSSTQRFTDVPPGYWAYNWINQLAAEGITGGCTATTFCPDNPVTRIQAAILLLKSKYGISYSPPPATGIFSDMGTSHWAAAWAEQLYREGITGGCSTSPLNYCPDSNVTRAVMSVLLVKTFNLSFSPSPIPSNTPTRTPTHIPTSTPTRAPTSTRTPTPVPFNPYDLNHDYHVNIIDYNMLVTGFGTAYDIFDYNQLLANFGT